MISTAYNENADYNISIPAGNMWDYHTYDEPSFFLDSFNFFDNWQEDTGNQDVTILAGEYSVFEVDEPTGKINFSVSNLSSYSYSSSSLDSDCLHENRIGSNRIAHLLSRAPFSHRRIRIFDRLGA